MPCHVKDSFNNKTGNMIEVKTHDGHEYDFLVKKRPGLPTRVHGSMYDNFLADYNMRSGDKIFFTMGDNDYGVIPIWPETSNGQPKKFIEGEESYLFVYTSSLNLIFL